MKKKSQIIVDIVAPASHCSHDELMAALEWVEAQGFIPRIQKDIIKPEAFFASSLSNQIKQLKKALLAKDSDIVWCLRGGYGSIRLLPELSKMKKPAKKKIFLGFSDITSLHLFFTQKWNWTTYHGPNVNGMSKKDPLAQDVKEVIHLFTEKNYNPVFDSLTPMNAHAKKTKKMTGTVSGGNLKVVQSGIGTKAEIKAKGKILFFEDVGERGYAIDRMFEQMWQSGVFKGVKAVIFGDFTDGLEKDGTDAKAVALQRFADAAPFPVLSGLACGHDKLNRVLPFNQKAVLTTGKNAQLVF